MAATVPVLNIVTAQQLDIIAYGNDTSSFDVAFTEDDGETPIDLTGIAFKMAIKIKPTDAKPKQSFDMDSGFSITGDDNNILSFDARILQKGMNYYYDIQATEDTRVTTYLYGQFLPLMQNITT